MHVGNLRAAAGRLQDALDELLRKWEQTRDAWNDDNSRNIEEQFLQPLAIEVQGALPSIGLMGQAIQQAVRETTE